MLQRLEVVPRVAAERRNSVDIDGLYDVQFASTGVRFNIHSTTLRGTLKGLIDLRDGNNTYITMDTVPSWPTGFNPRNPEAWFGAWPQVQEVDANGDPVYDIAGDPVMRPGTAQDFDSLNPDTWPVGTRGAAADEGAGTTTNFKGVPFYMNKLNNLVRTFARAMNEGRNAEGNLMPGVTGHIHGYDANYQNRQAMFFTFLDGTGQPQTVDNLRMWLVPPSPDYPDGILPRYDEDGNLNPMPANVLRDERGNPLFTLDYSRLDAFNIIVNPELVSDPSLFAASTNRNQGESNNDVVHGFNRIGSDRSLFREGSLADFIIATSSHLAVDTRQANNFRTSYAEITMQTHNHRLSIKGVDLNEEMMNLVRFQHMFIASSRLVNVLDTIYDTLINRLGNM